MVQPKLKFKVQPECLFLAAEIPVPQFKFIVAIKHAEHCIGCAKYAKNVDFNNVKPLMELMVRLHTMG